MTMNLTKNVHLPDMPSMSTFDMGVDMGNITDELRDFAGHAADAVSSAAGHVPGLDDYRSSGRRRRVLTIVGVVAIALVVAAIVRRRRQGDATTQTG